VAGDWRIDSQQVIVAAFSAWLRRPRRSTGCDASISGNGITRGLVGHAEGAARPLAA